MYNVIYNGFQIYQWSLITIMKVKDSGGLPSDSKNQQKHSRVLRGDSP